MHVRATRVLKSVRRRRWERVRRRGVGETLRKRILENVETLGPNRKARGKERNDWKLVTSNRIATDAIAVDKGRSSRRKRRLRWFEEAENREWWNEKTTDSANHDGGAPRSRFQRKLRLFQRSLAKRFNARV